MKKDRDKNRIEPTGYMPALDSGELGVRGNPSMTAPRAVAAQENDVGAIPAAPGGTVLPMVERVPLPTAPLAQPLAADTD